MSSSTDKRWNPWLIVGFSATVAGVILMDVVLLFALGNMFSFTRIDSTLLHYGMSLGAILTVMGILCHRRIANRVTSESSPNQ